MPSDPLVQTALLEVGALQAHPALPAPLMVVPLLKEIPGSGAARPGPRLVHNPSVSSSLQQPPAVRRWRRSLVRSCRNTPGCRTLIRMRSSPPSI
jgi:hypothetical protein